MVTNSKICPIPSIPRVLQKLVTQKKWEMILTHTSHPATQIITIAQTKFNLRTGPHTPMLELLCPEGSLWLDWSHFHGRVKPIEVLTQMILTAISFPESLVRRGRGLCVHYKGEFDKDEPLSVFTKNKET